jgi:DNA-binding NtrC family response regulator
MSTSSYSFAGLPPASYNAPKRGAAKTPQSDASDFKMVGESAAMKRLRLQIRRIGPHFRAVLVSGEPGTGKELTARALYRASPVADGPFVIYPPPAAVEDGAVGERLDHSLKVAQGGTLFVDGIGKMSLYEQSRLVQVLDRHDRSQESAPLKTGVRIIASTSEDLRVLTSAGRFRQDLYHRIAMVEISVPPLRERPEDIPALAAHFVRKFALISDNRGAAVAQDAMDRLREHDWPGNVSEMEAVMRNGVARADGRVVNECDLELPRGMSADVTVTSGVAETVRLQDVIERHVLHVLSSCGGNKLRAAEVLGISRSTLYRMLEAQAGDRKS